MQMFAWSDACKVGPELPQPRCDPAAASHPRPRLSVVCLMFVWSVACEQCRPRASDSDGRMKPPSTDLPDLGRPFLYCTHPTRRRRCMAWDPSLSFVALAYSSQVQ
jgi:hypothetical protein